MYAREETVNLTVAAGRYKMYLTTFSILYYLNECVCYFPVYE